MISKKKRGNIMRIGIDIDDVITDTSSSIRKYIENFKNNEDLYEHIEAVMRGEMPTENIKRFYKENSFGIFKDAKLKENASETIQELVNDGNEIYLITARTNEKFFDGIEQLTIDILKENNIPYAQIIFNSYDKAKICKDNNIDIMIDDSIQHCENVAKENIKTIVFTSMVNEKIKTSITRANNWIELKKEIYNYKGN